MANNDSNSAKKGFQIIVLITGVLIISGGILAILYYYGEILKIENIFWVILIAVVVFGIGILYAQAGFRNLKVMKKKTAVESKNSGFLSKVWIQKFFKGITIIFFLILIVGGPYILIDEVFAPQKIYPRTENVEYDPNYIFNSTLGNLSATVTALIPLGYPDPNNTDAYAWGEAYYLRYLNHYYNVTRNPAYIQEIVKRNEIVLHYSDKNNDGLPGFGTAKYTPEIGYVEYPVWDGMICLPMVEAAHLILNNDSLKAIYEINATRFIQTCELVIQKWDRTNWIEGDGKYGRWGLYVDEPDHPRTYNRFSALGRMLIELYSITKNSTYLDRITKMARFFKMAFVSLSYTPLGLTTKDSMYIWPYGEHIPNRLIGDKIGAEDTSHGSIEVDFMEECYRIGVVFTEADMIAVANTFFDFVFRGYTQNPILADRVDGDTGDGEMYNVVRHGFAKFYRFYRDPKLAKQILFKSMELLINAGNRTVGPQSITLYLLETETNNPWF